MQQKERAACKHTLRVALRQVSKRVAAAGIAPGWHTSGKTKVEAMFWSLPPKTIDVTVHKRLASPQCTVFWHTKSRTERTVLPAKGRAYKQTQQTRHRIFPQKTPHGPASSKYNTQVQHRCIRKRVLRLTPPAQCHIVFVRLCWVQT